MMKVGDVHINVKILDTPGINKQEKLVLEKMNLAHVVVFVYDVNGIQF